MKLLPMHFVIPDTQVKYGVPIPHLRWIGRYAVEHCAGKTVRFVHLGDHADMPSLSSYDKGKKAMENRRYHTDVKYANLGFDALNEPLWEHLEKHDEPGWTFDFLYGNHEYRIVRAAEDDPQLDGAVSLDDLNYEEHGWTTHPYQEVLWLDGIAYSHMFYNPMTGRAYGGSNLETRLRTIGHSFVMGHQQGKKYAVIDRLSGRIQGLVGGRCYVHDEDYLGPQGNGQWRGIFCLHEVHDGAYDLMEISLEYLCRRYEGKTLAQFLAHH